MTRTLLQIGEDRLIVNNYNNDFLLIQSEDKSTLSKIGTAIFQQNFDFIEEVIVTQVEICLKLNALFDNSKFAQLQSIQQISTTQHTVHKLPVYFKDTADWKNVEATTGFSKEIVINKLLQMDFTVAMFAFLPGFVYLNGLEESLHVPRKKVPAKYVAANSLAIGGKYLGIYSLPSPGGWHVIGEFPIPVLQLRKLPPVTLNLGDTLQLYRIKKERFNELVTVK